MLPLWAIVIIMVAAVGICVGGAVAAVLLTRKNSHNDKHQVFTKDAGEADATDDWEIGKKGDLLLQIHTPVAAAAKKEAVKVLKDVRKIHIGSRTVDRQPTGTVAAQAIALLDYTWPGVAPAQKTVGVMTVSQLQTFHVPDSDDSAMELLTNHEVHIPITPADNETAVSVTSDSNFQLATVDANTVSVTFNAQTVTYPVANLITILERVQSTTFTWAVTAANTLKLQHKNGDPVTHSQLGNNVAIRHFILMFVGAPQVA